MSDAPLCELPTATEVEVKPIDRVMDVCWWVSSLTLIVVLLTWVVVDG